MKREIFISKKGLALALIIVILIGLLPFNAIAADNVSGIKISAVKDSTGVTARMDNATEASVTASLCFAIYRPDGKLSYVKEYPVTAGANSSVNQKFEFDFSTQPDCIIKLFVWDGVSFIPMNKELSSCLSITIDGSSVVYDGIGINVTADPMVSEFMFVMIDEFTKRGAAYTGTKVNKNWAHTKMEGVDVVIAYKPEAVIGSVLPDLDVTELSVPGGVSKTRILLSQ